MSDRYVVTAPAVKGPVLRMQVGGRPTHWKIDGAAPMACADPGLVAGLPRAMRLSRPLHVEGRVSETLVSGVASAQRLLASWYPDRLETVPVHAATQPDPRRGSGVGLFFSGGVDAFYSLMQHRDELSHLMMVRGFDVKLGNDAVWQPIRDMGRTVAGALGVDYIEVKTNARRTVKGVSWLKVSHGAVLASVGLALQGTLGTALIASSRGPARLDPQGTHPDLDPLWSTTSIRFVHDAPVERLDKIAALLGFPLAMRWLRVCHRRPDRYNCGECEKCLRTMILLQVAGGLGRCETLPDRIDLKVVARLEHNSATLRRTRLLVAACEAHGLRDVAAALRRSMARHRRRRLIEATASPIQRRLRARRQRHHR